MLTTLQVENAKSRFLFITHIVICSEIIEYYLKEKDILIPIFEKNMIDYVLNNLTISINDKVFIIYNNNLDNYNFSTIIREKYPYINLININDTKGAVETLFIGIQFIIANYEYNDKCMLLDCDTFYNEDIITDYKKWST